MRIGILIALCILLGLAIGPARADLSAPIAGSAPILPSFTPGSITPRPTASTPLPPSSPVTSAPRELEPTAFAPLFDRRLSRAEKDADLPQDLLDALSRIEGLYDPTRSGIDDPGDRMRVSAGTNAMNNVFADRWRSADTDANVDYRVRYIAQAWQKPAVEPCDAFSRRRAGNAIIELSALTPADCRRIALLRDARDDVDWRRTIVIAPLAVPVFAAPEPGSRMTSQEFWAAQKARIAAIQARIAFERGRHPSAEASR